MDSYSQQSLSEFSTNAESHGIDDMNPLKKRHKKVPRACTNCQKAHLPCEDIRPCTRCVKKGLSDECHNNTKKLAKYLLEDLGNGNPVPASNAFENSSKKSPISMAASPRSSDNSFGYTDLFTFFPTISSPNIPKSDYMFINMKSNPFERNPNLFPPINPQFIYDRDTESKVSIKMRQFFYMSFQKAKSSSDLNEFPTRYYPSITDDKRREFIQSPGDFLYETLSQNSFMSGNKSQIDDESNDHDLGFYSYMPLYLQSIPTKDAKRIFRAITLANTSILSARSNYSIEYQEFNKQVYSKNITKISRFIKLASTPTIAWKRSGLISFVSREFTILTGWTKSQLVTERKYLFDIIESEDAAEYWEKVSYDTINHMERGSTLNLTITKYDQTKVRCACYFTIKRDLLDIPNIVIGSFLPVLS